MSDRNVTRIDFHRQLGLDREEEQLSLFREAGPEPSPPFVHPALGRAITAAAGTLHPTALALARALATFMREERAGTFTAWPSRESVLARAGFSSITTYKRHMPDVLDCFGIAVDRRRRGSNRYTWIPCTSGGGSTQVLKGPRCGPSKHVTGSRCGPGHGPLYGPPEGPRCGPLTEEKRTRAPSPACREAAARAALDPTASRILCAAGWTRDRFAQALCDLPSAEEHPARFLAALEKSLASGASDPAREAWRVMHGMAGRTTPAMDRIQELEACLASVRLTPDPGEEADETEGAG